MQYFDNALQNLQGINFRANINMRSNAVKPILIKIYNSNFTWSENKKKYIQYILSSRNLEHNILNDTKNPNVCNQENLVL